MKTELENRLFEKYPHILKRSEVYSLEIQDGWYELIDSLCCSIMAHMQNRPTMRAPVAVQIKEKFGGLRFYARGEDEFSAGLIAFAEAYSYKICEVCGQSGKARKGLWIRTLCDLHDRAQTGNDEK